ncbi:transcription factor bHLH90 isoform X2 [Malania oleifera]|uniref:transcription factor bHLH90 isoform X2 n=1 Tax=Malania oleifera TaxID=397392 RepID=UPI0025ADA56B|nr:transcription factor bHLH90 isoform X2 [Malania oleifera]
MEMEARKSSRKRLRAKVCRENRRRVIRKEGMRALEKALDCLRPLVETKTWDYCVVWKLGDDPSRFVEWMGCCCSGGYDHHSNDILVKEETEGCHIHLPSICRDTHIQHHLRTKACEALAHLPSSIPLYVGIHGEVVASTQPRWLSHANVLDSNLSQESSGTQVLIPVVGGLIELFTAKNMPRDPKIIEHVKDQCTVTCEQEAITGHCYTCEQPHHEHVRSSTFPHYYFSSIPGTQSPPSAIPISSCPSFEGTSSGSNHSNEHHAFDSGSLTMSHMALSLGKSHRPPRPEWAENFPNQEISMVLVGGNHVSDNKANMRASQRPEQEKYQSKNLVTERNRRNRIRDGLFTLRALVPKISKMDRAATLGDAIGYIEELQKEVKKLKQEILEIDEEASNWNNVKWQTSELKGGYGGKGNSPAIGCNESRSPTGKMKQFEGQVEVHQIGKSNFLLKILSEHKQGGFAKLMEAINYLGLQVVDANVTTFDGKVLNILKVEAGLKEMQPKKLRESLFKLLDLIKDGNP